MTLLRSIILLAALSPLAHAQYWWVLGGPSSTMPKECVPGQQFIASDIATGSNIYYCEPIGPNTGITQWTPLQTPSAAVSICTFGASCTATGACASSATDQNAAIQNLLAAGYTSFTLPASCTWVVPGVPALIPAGISVFGVNWLTSIIKSSSSGTAVLQAGAGAQLYNVNLVNTPNPPSGVNCPIVAYQNLSSVTDPVVTTTCYSGWHFYLNGDSYYPGIGTSGTNLRNHGYGDGIFVGQYDTYGAGIRSDLESGNGTAVVVDLNCTDAPCSAGAGGISVVENNSAANVALPFAWSSNFRTSGSVFQFTHGYGAGASAYTGDFINIGAALFHGSFTGNFLNFGTGGVQMFHVDAAGDVLSHGVIGSTATTVTVANGANQNVNISGAGTVIFTGPTGAFSIGGIVAPASGAGTVTLYVNFGQTMTINDEDAGSLPANRFFIPFGGNYVCAHTYCIVQAQYIGGQWVLMGAN